MGISSLESSRVGSEVGTRPRFVRLAAWAGIVYAAVWIIGLFVAPPAPEPFASAAEVNDYFVRHNGASLTQALFVHALAGVALVVFVLGVSRHIRVRAVNDGATTLGFLAGIAAALVSLIQFGLAVALYLHVDDDGSATRTKSLFDAINKADTIKLILLAVFIGAASVAARRVRLLPTWVVWVGAVAVVALIVGGVAFLVDSAVLTGFLDASLVLLLLWVVATSIVMLRHREPVGGNRPFMDAHAQRETQLRTAKEER